MEPKTKEEVDGSKVLYGLNPATDLFDRVRMDSQRRLICVCPKCGDEWKAELSEKLRTITINGKGES